MMRFALALAATIPAAVMAAPPPATGKGAPAPAAAYSLKTKMGVLMDDPAALAVLRRHAPTIMADPRIGESRNYSVRFVAGFDRALKVALPAIEADLARLRAVPTQSR